MIEEAKIAMHSSRNAAARSSPSMSEAMAFDDGFSEEMRPSVPAHSPRRAPSASPSHAALSALPALRSTPLVELQASLQRAGFPAWRAKQVFQWVFRQDARTLDAMTNVPKDIRTFLAGAYRWGGVETVAAERRAHDGTVKFLLRLADGATTESVLMPNEDHYTLCLSTQVGCALGCGFCLTGAMGWTRHLETAEIVDQVLFARRFLGERSAHAPDAHAPDAHAPDAGAQTPPLRNLVLMGMGEPMLNLDAVIPALRLLTLPDGPGFSPRRITVSTAGVVPGIERLGAAGTGVRLAISLNATTDAVRARLMPIARKYPLETLLEACRRYPLTQRSRITFEYVMIAGLNDSMDDARRLVGLLHAIPCKVNLIPFNEHPELPYKRPTTERVEAFREFLASKYLTATVRVSKGADIEAACGQLHAATDAAADEPAIPSGKADES